MPMGGRRGGYREERWEKNIKRWRELCANHQSPSRGFKFIWLHFNFNFFSLNIQHAETERSRGMEREGALQKDKWGERKEVENNIQKG